MGKLYPLVVLNHFTVPVQHSDMLILHHFEMNFVNLVYDPPRSPTALFLKINNVTSLLNNRLSWTFNGVKLSFYCQYATNISKFVRSSPVRAIMAKTMDEWE